MARSEILLHPVRLRIVQAFLGDRLLTTAQLADELDDVPAGSLYRHVALLAEAGILRVASERRVRGSVERTYLLALAAASVGPKEAAAMTPAQHSDAFVAFTASLISTFDRYLATGTPDLARDGAGYSMNAMWLTDPEFFDLARELASTLQSRLANGPAEGRQRRLLASVFVPAPTQSEREVAGTPVAT